MTDVASETARMEASEPTLIGLLVSRRFCSLMAATFLAYANISVFFSFVEHLQSLPIDSADYGILIGSLAAASLVVRPVISPFFHAGNARRMLIIGTLLSAGSLAAYSFAGGLFSMLTVRILHGAAFAVLGTALMALIIEEIPREKSAQFFGYLSIVTLIPNTLVPPLLPFLKIHLGGFNQILLIFALLTLCIIPLVLSKGADGKKDLSPRTSAPLTKPEIMANLGDLNVLRILGAMLLFYCGHALVFFFLDGFSRHIGLAFGGIFLTLSTIGEIGIRVGAGSAFDRMNKYRLAALTLLGLAIAYMVLAHVQGKWLYLGLGLFFGLGWGIAMPVFNGLMFDVSSPNVRALNINLGLQMFQAGFFLGPILGAPLLSRWGYPALYHLCAGMSLISAILLLKGGVWKNG
jgi:predicted MFS family arabinose efflux permease